MTIGPATSGYRRVALRCEADNMEIEVEMENEFSGVMYTRGSFHQKLAPCFLDADGGRSFSLRFPLKKCKTTNVSTTEIYFMIAEIVSIVIAREFHIFNVLLKLNHELHFVNRNIKAIF